MWIENNRIFYCTSCCGVSMPSIVVLMPKLRLGSTIARVVASVAESVSTSRTNERAIDLDAIERKVAQVDHRRIAGAKIVQRHLHARTAHLTQRPEHVDGHAIASRQARSST